MNIIKDVQTTNISQLETEIVLLKNQTAQNIIEIGKRLNKAKEMLPHGEWGKWLEDKVDFRPETASRIMRVANEYPNLTTTSNIGIGKAFELLALPQAERQEFIDNHPVEDMTTRELRQAIKKNKELESQFEVFAEKTSSQIYDLTEENQKLKAQKTKIIEKEVIPEGYITKDNFNKLRQEFREKVDENHELKKQLEAAIITDTKEEHQKKIKHSAITFSNRVHSFINDVGGLGWLIDYLDDLPTYEKEEYIKAVNLLYQWAETIKSNF